MADTNGFDSAAWSVDGARIDSDLMRAFAYMGTNGADGIATAGDCKVEALGVPSGQVTISTGAVAIRNRSAGVKNQTYIANARTQTILDVAPNLTNAQRSDIVCVRVEDPEFAGWPTPAAGTAPTFQYVKPKVLQNVSPTAAKWADLALAYAGYAFARIDIPPMTSAITNAMIKPLRKVANPRRDSYMERIAIPYQPNESGSVSNVWIKYPDVPFVYIEVPDFAAIAKVRAWVIGVQARDSSIAGYFRWKMSAPSPAVTAYSENTYLNEQTPGDNRVGPYLIGSSMPIPASMRGQLAQCNVEFSRIGGTGFLRSVSDVQVVIDIDFIEAAS